MPNYNNGPFLREAIDSILKQTFNDFILLIIDDGSTDNSVEIIKSYTDPRIRLIEKGYNSGIVDTLNIGLDQVTTKYIARMDGDDLSTPDRLEVQYRFMEEHPEVGICSGQLVIYGKENIAPQTTLNRQRIKAQLVYRTSLNHAVCMMRTSVLKDNGIRYTNDHPYMEDYDIFFRMKGLTEYANLEKVLYYYRVLEHNSTVKNYNTLLQRYCTFYKQLVLPELQIEPSDENAILHAELLLWAPLTHDLNKYLHWQKLLLRQNSKLNIYPQQELKNELMEKWRWFYFSKVAGRPLSASIRYFWLSRRVSFGQLYYLLKTKLRKSA